MALTKTDLKNVEALMDRKFGLHGKGTEAGFRAQDERIEAGFRAQDERIEAGFRAQDERIEAGFRAQDERIENRFETHKTDIVDAVRDEITKFKSDMFSKIDPILKEVKTNREERTVMNDKINRNTKRIEKLEVRLAAQ